MPEFRAAIPPAHRRFLKELRLSFEAPGLFFCHAGIAPDRPIDRQTSLTLLFGDDAFLDHDGDYGRRIVHGHWRSQEPVIRTNRIGIDTGAGYRNGSLAAVRIDGGVVAVIT